MKTTAGTGKSATGSSAEHEADHEAAVRAVIDAVEQATRRKDAAAVTACFTSDRVQFLLAPPLQYGPQHPWDAKTLQGWFAGFSTPVGYESRDLHITAGDDVAFSHALKHMTGTKTDGTRVDLWLRETLCFARLGDVWKITHQHQSVPFLMDGSDKAALELKP